VTASIGDAGHPAHQRRRPARRERLGHDHDHRQLRRLAGPAGSATSRPTWAWTREIVYYTSRTNTQLTVPAAGRSQLGTTAAAGASTDSSTRCPGSGWPRRRPTGSAVGQRQTIANENTAPTGVTWNTGTTKATGVSHRRPGGVNSTASLDPPRVVAGAVAEPTVLRLVNFEFDAA
jgi:hypothetical protein